MEKRRRHFVLVHGAAHGAWCWYKVATLLKSAGHKVTALNMAASGTHPKQVHQLQSISDYFEPLMEFMSSLQPEERVILVGHSMGGYCISVAMEKFPEKISVGVYVAAFMPDLDLNFTPVREEHSRKFGSLMDCQHIFDDGPDNPPTSVIIGLDFLSSRLYQLCPLEDLELATLSLRPFRLFSDDDIQDKTVLTKEKFGSVPRVYIICDQDNSLKEDFQRWMVENCHTDETKVISGADHMVMLSKPKDLCSSLVEIGEKYL